MMSESCREANLGSIYGKLPDTAAQESNGLPQEVVYSSIPERHLDDDFLGTL